MAVADSAPELSLAVAVNALSVPLAFAAGIQNADLVASITLFVVLHGVAAPGLIPIFKVPLETALTTKAVMEPSVSASFPAAIKSLREIATSASSLLVLTEVPNEVSVGAVLPPLTDTTA